MKGGIKSNGAGGHPGGHPSGGGGHPGELPEQVATRLVGDTWPGHVFDHAPRNVYWETTLACDLACRHCRADAQPDADPRELTTEEGRALLRSVKELGSMVVLTGGDPMKRPDLFELIEYARGLRVPVAVTPSTTPMLERGQVLRMRELGVSALGVSIDAPDAASHDGFRQVPGTFDCSMNALAWAREAGIAVQVNTTVTTETMPRLEELFRLLADEQSPPVRRWSLFLLVPVGRGLELGVPSAGQVEDLFGWVYEISRDAPFHVSTVEAPHYRRYWIQRRLEEGSTADEINALGRRMGFGFRDGNGIVFVSHTGDVYPAGFLPHPLLGNVRGQPLEDIYRRSPALIELRDADRLEGACGECDYRYVCGGSRARGYSMTGSALGPDPFCVLAS